MGVFEDGKTGLEQAVDFEKGALDAKTVTLSITFVKSLPSEENDTLLDA